MSMAVDMSTPLSTKERAYLIERGRYADVERSDSVHGGSTPESLLRGDGTGPGVKSILTSERAKERRAELLAELEALGSDDTEAPESDTDDEGIPYESWKPEELKAELKDRNLAVSGTKVELIERLYADDAKSAQQ